MKTNEFELTKRRKKLSRNCITFVWNHKEIKELDEQLQQIEEDKKNLTLFYESVDRILRAMTFL